jgi:hypothetical protein
VGQRCGTLNRSANVMLWNTALTVSAVKMIVPDCPQVSFADHSNIRRAPSFQVVILPARSIEKMA